MPEPPRQIGLVAATSLVVGQVVGIGIFLTPAEMAQRLAAPGLVLAMWAAMGLMALTGALCYGELSSRFPEAGGAYVFLREGFGEGAAFLFGWMCLLVMDPGITAALAAGLADYVAFFFPAVPPRLVASAAILCLAAITALGTRLAASALVSLTLLKLSALAAIVVWGLARAEVATLGGLFSFERPPGAPDLVVALAGGFVAAFFSFGGWWEAARMAGEVRDPERTLPLAFVIGVLLVTLVYALVSAVFMALVPSIQAGAATAFAARLGERLFGPAGGAVLALCVIVSVTGSLAAVMLGCPRTYLALSRDGLLPLRLAQLHPTLGTPLVGIGIQTSLACGLVAIGTFSDIVAYFVFATVAFIAASVAALYRLPPPPHGVFRTPVRGVTPAVFVGLCLLLLLLLLAGKPTQALSGVAVVAVGVPVHAALRRSGVLRRQVA